MKKTNLIKALKAIHSFGGKNNLSSPVLDNLEISPISINCIDKKLESMLTIPPSILGLSYNEPSVLPVLVNSKAFVALIESSPFDLKIELEDKNCHFENDGQVFSTLPSHKKYGYPEKPYFENDEDNFIVRNCQELKSQIDSSVKYANKDSNSRYLLDSVLFDLKNGYLVSTNQVQLRAIKIACGHEESFALATRHLKVLSALLGGLSKMDNVVIDLYGNSVNFKFSCGVSYFVRKMEAQFPQYINAVQKFGDHSNIELDRDSLKKSCDSIKSLTNKNQLTAIMSFTEGLNSFDLSINSVSGKMSIKEQFLSVCGAEAIGTFQAGLNIPMILDFLKDTEKGEKLKAYITSGKTPICISDKKGFFFMSPTKL